MTQTRSDRTGSRTRRAAALIGLAVASAAPAPTGSARAATLPAPILARINHEYRTSNPIRISGGEVASLRSYLNHGPAFWATHEPPKFPEGLILSYPNGALRPTRLVSYLSWARSQNPLLWDYRHPRIAPLFQQYSQTPAQAQAQAAQLTQTISRATQSAGFQVLIPPVTRTEILTAPAPAPVPVPLTSPSATGTTTPAAVPAPAPVPEPASVATTLLLFGAAAGWWCRSRRRA